MLSKISSSFSVQFNMITIVCLIFLLNQQYVHLEKINSSSNIHEKVVPPLRKRSAFPERRLDCDLFCRRTGFAGSIGGCQCGYTLFNVKRSDELSDYTDEPWLNWIKLRRSKFLDKIGSSSNSGLTPGRLSPLTVNSYNSEPTSLSSSLKLAQIPEIRSYD
ncbi:uncharacterized protein LOC128388628 [Panonychus citri]|uniref:uncharacterized protein LOC128388628 n=1 Tax=Panonychus citri TaxID=50023 RepID=UPI0023071F0A|nr:uncharacterized protein LOC128388628 [Panonychus citri]